MTQAASNCRPSSPLRARASSDWNSSQNAANPRPDGSATVANSATRQHAAVTGMRRTSPETAEPAHVCATLHRVGAQQQQRPAQRVAYQRQPCRLERVRLDRRQVCRPGEQGHPERHRRHPEQMQRADRRRRVQRVRERGAQRSDGGNGGARQQQRRGPPKRLPRAAQVEQHAEHQIDRERRADPGQCARACQHESQHGGGTPPLGRRHPYGRKVTRRTRQRERHHQADRRKDGEAQRHAAAQQQHTRRQREAIARKQRDRQRRQRQRRGIATRHDEEQQQQETRGQRVERQVHGARGRPAASASVAPAPATEPPPPAPQPGHRWRQRRR
jgi:hypothetical protein